MHDPVMHNILKSLNAVDDSNAPENNGAGASTQTATESPSPNATAMASILSRMDESTQTETSTVSESATPVALDSLIKEQPSEHADDILASWRKLNNEK